MFLLRGPSGTGPYIRAFKSLCEMRGEIMRERQELKTIRVHGDFGMLRHFRFKLTRHTRDFAKLLS